MKTIGLKMGVLALVAVTLVSLIPGVGSYLFAPIVAFVIGAIAGWWATRVADSGRANASVKAGALAGIGALLGSIIGLTILLLVVVDVPAVQDAIRNSEPHPEARVPYAWMAPLAALGGIVGGFVFGLVDLVLSIVGGLIAGLVYGRQQKTMA